MPPKLKKSRKKYQHIPVAAMQPPNERAAFFQHVRALTNHRAEIKALVTTELERLLPTPEIDTPPAVTAKIKRQAHLNALRSWKSTASARLQDLKAGRLGNGPNSPTISPSDQPEAAKLMRRLIVSLSKNAARTSNVEGAQRRWYAAAKSARESIRLRSDTAREILGDALPRDARLDLKLAQTTFMTEGNSPRLRQEVKKALVQSPKSKGLAYWLARYEVMAGNFKEASQAIVTAGDYLHVSRIILPMLRPEFSNTPWLSWPCNFYSYRYALVENPDLIAMQRVLATAFNNDPRLNDLVETFRIPQSAIDQIKERAVEGGQALASLLLWNQANLDMRRSKYASAARNYEDCQRTIVNYFASRYSRLKLSTLSAPDESSSDPGPAAQLDNALEILAKKLIRSNGFTPQIWTFFRERYMALTIEELHNHDWRRPEVVPLAYEFAKPLPDYGDSTDFGTALARMLTQMSILKSLQTSGEKVEEKIDAPLLAIALVFCPLGIAEANRLRHQFDKALTQCTALLRRHSQYAILSEAIEKPFAKILRAQILLDKADAQYKARTRAAHPSTVNVQGLEAHETYRGVLINFQDQGQYVNLVNASLVSMKTQLEGLLEKTFHPITAKRSGTSAPPLLTPNDRNDFALLGKKLTIDGIKPRLGDFPEPNRSVHPHESLIRFEATGGAFASRETNPQIYALIVEARARMLQIESGLNYLGYSDQYVPPWRFQFLLDRARYFAEHAKTAQREYLNFLSNAEREEFQELNTAQNVELEKSNIQIETARVEQVKLEVAHAKASEELGRLAAANARSRFEGYVEFDKRADDLAGTGSVADILDFAFDHSPGGELANKIGGKVKDLAQEIQTGVTDFFTGGSASRAIDRAISSEQREYEKFNLSLATSEAEQSAVVAQRQLEVAQAGLLVAGMQRAAAVLRHEFALQNLSFIRNRTLNAELWYRLSAAIRSVADTYLRYGIEMAFLAEQAYEFEVDKRINVIRFDYDLSDVGNMLAGDFLLRDLDTLEQDLIVGQKIRQQQVRYMLSLSREFPAALQELRDHGTMTFSLRLEQVERRFPGLFNLRISSVDVLPLALIDPTRFSLELTHLGSGQVRLHADSTDPEELLGEDWLNGVEADWSIRHRSTPPETAVFSGISRQDIGGTAAFFASNQLGAFEGLAAASAWEIDLSMKENRIVPNSLTDLLITFNLSGYYDATLRDAADHAPRQALATTTWFSAHENFPDAFYEFNQSGRMDWQVTADSLALQGSVGALRNVAVICTPSQKRPDLGRVMCSYPVEFEVDQAGSVQLLRELPIFSLSTSGLVLSGVFAGGSVVTFDFGDGTPLADSSELPHTYARPGRYDVLVRIAANQRLTEYRAAVVVSRQHSVQAPCITFPKLEASVVGAKIKLTPTLQVASGETLSVTWRINKKGPDEGSEPATFTLDPGRYILRFSANRPLMGRFYSQQRFEPAKVLPLTRLFLATNRTFNAQGEIDPTTRNEFAKHVFDSGTLSPTDRWTLELPMDDNPALVSVSSADVKQHDLSELSNAMLALEYEVRDV